MSLWLCYAAVGAAAFFGIAIGAAIPENDRSREAKKALAVAATFAVIAIAIALGPHLSWIP